MPRRGFTTATTRGTRHRSLPAGRPRHRPTTRPNLRGLSLDDPTRFIPRSWRKTANTRSSFLTNTTLLRIAIPCSLCRMVRGIQAARPTREAPVPRHRGPGTPARTRLFRSVQASDLRPHAFRLRRRARAARSRIARDDLHLRALSGPQDAVGRSDTAGNHATVIDSSR